MKTNLFPIPGKIRASHIPAQALIGEWYLVPKGLITDKNYDTKYICWKYHSPNTYPHKDDIKLEKRFFGF